MGGKLALPPPERLVVAARYREDILWMHEQLADLPYLVYQDGDPSAPLKVAAGPPATEAKAYLKFILDNYDRLPNITVFIHAHRESWCAITVPMMQCERPGWPQRSGWLNVAGNRQAL